VGYAITAFPHPDLSANRLQYPVLWVSNMEKSTAAGMSYSMASGKPDFLDILLIVFVRHIRFSNRS
jgi:hypothetical protein